MAIYENTVEEMKLRGSAIRGIPGALAFFAAIGFGVGIIDSDMRDQLPWLLVGCAVVAVVFGVWHFRIASAMKRPIAVRRDEEQLRVEVAGVSLAAPDVSRGVFLVQGVKRSFWVAWVRIDDGERSVVVRKGLGIADAKPSSWVEGGYEAPTEPLYYGDAVSLARALGAG